MNEEKVNVMKYIGIFVIAHVVITLIIVVVAMFVNVGSSMGTVLPAIGASYFVADRFVKDNLRAPQGVEKTQLIWLSFLMTWVLSIVYTVIAYFVVDTQAKRALSEGLGAIGSFWVYALGLFLFVSLILLLMFTVNYGFFARKQAERL